MAFSLDEEELEELARICKESRDAIKSTLDELKKNGYLAINLYNKKCKHYYIHRLVAEHFINNPLNLKYVNHIDCDKHNNNPRSKKKNVIPKPTIAPDLANCA